MLHPTTRVRATSGEQTKRDQLREQQAIAELWLDPRLQQYRRERIGREHIETSGLVEAADRTFIEQQHWLREPGLERAAAVELFLVGRWSIAAWRYVFGNKAAKARQIALADGSPLTVCAGSLTLGLPFGTVLDLVGAAPSTRAPAHGCFCVFEDSIRTDVAKKWRWYCDDCTHAHRQRRRDQQRAVQRQAKVVRKQRFGSPRDEAQILAEFRATTMSVTHKREA